MKMKKKWTFFDIVAACLLIFNIDWDDEYEILEVDDIFWDIPTSQAYNNIIEVGDIQDTKTQVS